MNSNEKTSIQYWKLIRVGKAKKVLEDFNGAIKAYSKAIEINKNNIMLTFIEETYIPKLKIMIMQLAIIQRH